MTQTDYDYWLKRIFQENTEISQQMKRDDCLEIDMDDGTWQVMGKSGRVYAKYGPNVRQTIVDLNAKNN